MSLGPDRPPEDLAEQWRRAQGRRRRRYWLTFLTGACAEPPAPAAEHRSDIDDAVMAEMTIDLWRASRKLEKGDSERDDRGIARHVASVQRRFAGLGVEVQGHDGLQYDPGLQLDVVAWEPRDVEGDVVIETITPSIYRNNVQIHIGQVVVAYRQRDASQASSTQGAESAPVDEAREDKHASND